MLKNQILFTLLFSPLVLCIPATSYENIYYIISTDTSIFLQNDNTINQYLLNKGIATKKSFEHDTTFYFNVKDFNNFKIGLCDGKKRNFCYLEYKLSKKGDFLRDKYINFFKIDPMPIKTYNGIQYQWHYKNNFYLSILIGNNKKTTVQIYTLTDYD